MADDPFNKLKALFFSSVGSQMNKCLERSMQCTNKAIRAHSIQNARVLDLLCEKGHVIQFKLKVNGDSPPIPEYKNVGRNQATTFSGLCSEHDRIIFEDIDTKELDHNNFRQLFLLTYRAVLRELHATMDAAVSIQGAYQKRVELGLDPKDVPSTAGKEAVFHMIKSWRTYRYKCIFDNIEDVGTYNNLVHFIRVIQTDSPTVAASVLFGVGKYTGGEDIIGVVLNIVPLDSSNTIIVFSYLRDHEPYITKEFPRLFEAEGYYFNYMVSKILLKYGENFVINPAYFSKWPQGKRDKILEYFIKTMVDSDHEEESEHLYLF